MRYEKLGFEIASLSVDRDENTLYCVSPIYFRGEWPFAPTYCINIDKIILPRSQRILS